MQIFGFELESYESGIALSLLAALILIVAAALAAFPALTLVLSLYSIASMVAAGYFYYRLVMRENMQEFFTSKPRSKESLELLELDLSNLNPHLKQYIQALKKAEYRAYRVFPKLSSNVEISEEIWDRINALRPCQSMALSFYYNSKDGINAGHHVLIYKDSLGYTYFFDSNNPSPFKFRQPIQPIRILKILNRYGTLHSRLDIEYLNIRENQTPEIDVNELIGLEPSVMEEKIFEISQVKNIPVDRVTQIIEGDEDLDNAEDSFRNLLASDLDLSQGNILEITAKYFNAVYQPEVPIEPDGVCYGLSMILRDLLSQTGSVTKASYIYFSWIKELKDYSIKHFQDPEKAPLTSTPTSPLLSMINWYHSRQGSLLSTSSVNAEWSDRYTTYIHSQPGKVYAGATCCFPLCINLEQTTKTGTKEIMSNPQAVFSTLNELTPAQEHDLKEIFLTSNEIKSFNESLNNIPKTN